MDYSYEVGLQASIWVGATAAAVGLLIAVVLMIAEREDFVANITTNAISLSLIAVFLSSIAGLVIFCASLTILNPLLQVEQLGLASLEREIERELSNGVFALRIASLVVCYRTIGYIVQIVLVDPPLTYFDARFFDRPSTRYPELNELDEIVDDSDQDIVYLSQWGVYAMVLTNLWVLTILPQESNLVAVLSFGLFFIFDDWTIITEYARSLKGRILPSHAARVHFFNVVLIGPLLVLIFQQFSWPGAIISGIVILILLLTRYAYASYSRGRFSAVGR